MSVVFPAPEGPMMAVREPGVTRPYIRLVITFFPGKGDMNVRRGLVTSSSQGAPLLRCASNTQISRKLRVTLAEAIPVTLEADATHVADK